MEKEEEKTTTNGTMTGLFPPGRNFKRTTMLEDTTVKLISVLLWVKTSNDGQYPALQWMELRVSYGFTFYGVYVGLFCFIGK